MRNRKLLAMFLSVLALPVPAALAEEVAEVPYALVVEDAATGLRLVNDSVNADGKVKSPGDALVTRVEVSDANGLDDVATLSFRYFRGTAEGRRLVAERAFEGLDGGDRNRTTVLVEDRFAVSPLKDGSYVANVTAVSRAGRLVHVERTFVIRDVAPTLVGWGVPTTAAPGAAIETVARVGDANFGAGPLDPVPVTALGTLTLKAFRGSAAAPGWMLRLNGTEGTASGVAVSLATLPSTSPAVSTEGGLGVLAVPVVAVPPPEAAEGQYRLSLYHTPPGATTAALLGSRTLSIVREARVLSVGLEEDEVARGGALTLAASLLPGGASARVEVTLLQRDGASWIPVGGALWNSTVDALPRNGSAAVLRHAWPEAGALALGPSYAARLRLLNGNGTTSEHVLPWRLANTAPALTAAPCDGAPARLDSRTPLALCAAAADPEGDPLGTVQWELLDWNGAVVREGLRISPNGTRFVATASVDLPPGRYTLRAIVEDAGGANATASLAVDVGAWAGLEVGDSRLEVRASPGGRFTGRLGFQNRGHAPIRELAVVATEAPVLEGARVRLLAADGSEVAAGLLRGGAVAFAPASGTAVGPRAPASLEVEFAPRPCLGAGTYTGTLRIIARPEAAR